MRLNNHIRDGAYWTETASLVFEYFTLQAGSATTKTLWLGFVEYLNSSSIARRAYEDGDDMARAALVDGYLKIGQQL